MKGLNSKMKKALKAAQSGELNPSQMLEDVQNVDNVKQIKNLAKNTEDAINMLQEHIMVVQQNQVHFQEYFKEMDRVQKEILKKIEELKK